jgi:hypothetical protein
MNLYKTDISPEVVLTFVGVFGHNLEFFDQSIQFLGKGAHLFLLTTMLQNGFFSSSLTVEQVEYLSLSVWS